MEKGTGKTGRYRKNRCFFLPSFFMRGRGGRGRLLLFLALPFFIAGCRSLQETEQPTLQAESLLKIEPPNWLEELPETALPAETEAALQETEVSSATAAGPDAFYGYSSLQTAEEQQLYREILRSLQKQEKETQLTTLKADFIEPVFNRVMADHPELFYAEGYSTTVYHLGSELKKLLFSGAYTMDKEAVVERRERIEEAVARCFADMPAGLDDYGKTKYLYEYVIFHTEYQLDAADSQNIASVFLNGLSVCQGYARALQLLLQRQGLECILANGTVNGQSHAWIVAKLDGEWYHIDPAWGDAAYLLEGQEITGQCREQAVNYDYFCVTTDQLLATHSPGTDWSLPACSAVKNQYYRREGLLLEKADMEQACRIIRKTKEEGKNAVTLQCADDAVYREVYRRLITEQEIFACLQEKRAAYAVSPKQRTLTFWYDYPDISGGH